jgi:hypothetical protein
MTLVSVTPLTSLLAPTTFITQIISSSILS